MPTTSILPACSRASLVRCGIAALHGPHQVAQKSMTHTLPGSSIVNGSPFSHLATWIAGGGLPISRAGSLLVDVDSVFAGSVAAGVSTGGGAVGVCASSKPGSDNRTTTADDKQCSGCNMATRDRSCLPTRRRAVAILVHEDCSDRGPLHHGPDPALLAIGTPPRSAQRMVAPTGCMQPWSPEVASPLACKRGRTTHVGGKE